MIVTFCRTVILTVAQYKLNEFDTMLQGTLNSIES